MTHRDRVSSPLGASRTLDDGSASPSHPLLPSGLETRPAGRPFESSGRRPAPLMMRAHHLATHSLPEDPKGRHDESLSVSFGMTCCSSRVPVLRRHGIGREVMGVVVGKKVVVAGTLPPMAERLPRQPLVLDPRDRGGSLGRVRTGAVIGRHTDRTASAGSPPWRPWPVSARREGFAASVGQSLAAKGPAQRGSATW